MKKLLLSIILFAGLQTGIFSQDDNANGGGGNANYEVCYYKSLSDLSLCLASNEITHQLLFGDDVVYVMVEGRHPYGQIRSCVVHYNSERRSCGEAPEAIICTE